MKLLLFDIDGTLLHSGGAGLRAMSQAFEELHDIPEAFEGISLAGRTDTAIVKEVFDHHQAPLSEFVLTRYKNRYFELIAKEMQVDNPKKQLMPGVTPLLEHLRTRQDVYMGLLTGNWETSGRIKLAHFELSNLFAFGAFADDSHVRNELVPFALQRFTRHYGLSIDPENVYVIGDTPSDINCTKPHNVRSVAVGAAHYTVDQLKKHDPDFLVESLEDTEQLLSIIG